MFILFFRQGDPGTQQFLTSPLSLHYGSPFVTPGITSFLQSAPTMFPFRMYYYTLCIPPPCLSPNWTLTDWFTLHPPLTDRDIPLLPSHPTRVSLEILFDRDIFRHITHHTSRTPTRPPPYRSIPWRSPLLSLFMKEFHTAMKRARSSLLQAHVSNNRLSNRATLRQLQPPRQPTADRSWPPPHSALSGQLRNSLS